MERTITVVGHGIATVVPDLAVVRVSVAAVESSVAVAWLRVSKLTDRAVATARALVEDRGLEAHVASVWPQHGSEGPPRYEARRGVVVHCPDLEVAGGLLEALVAEVGDALQIEGIGLEVGDPSEAMDQARNEAFGDAEVKAGRLAERAGASLGAVIAIDESGHDGSPRPMARALRAETAALVPGEQQLAASLQITWQLV